MKILRKKTITWIALFMFAPSIVLGGDITDILIEKQKLTLSEVKKPVVPALLGLFPGFGIGSFIQKDKIGGIVGLSLDLGGSVLFISGVAFAFGGLINDALDSSLGGIIGGGLVILIGSAILISSKIYQIVRPIVFYSEVKKANRTSLVPGIEREVLNYHAWNGEKIDRNGTRFSLNLATKF